MESALRGDTSTTHQPSERPPGPDENQIVIVRPAVVEHVGHALGNLFQRIYHLIDQIPVDQAATGPLGTSVRQLEDFLQLVIDYFSPLPLALQHVPSTEVAQSLARQISDTVGCAVQLDAELPIEGGLLVDPGQLARTFGLLAKQLEHAPRGERIILKATVRSPNRSLVFGLRAPGACDYRRSSEAEMRWAVAEKLIEMHGGTVQQDSGPAGDVLWEIVLPLQC